MESMKTMEAPVKLLREIDGQEYRANQVLCGRAAVGDPAKFRTLECAAALNRPRRPRVNVQTG